MAAAGIHPDLQTVTARAGDHVGPSVPVDVCDDEAQNHVVGAQPLHDRRSGEANVQFRQSRRQIDAIVNTIAVEIGVERVGQGGGGEEQCAHHEERTGQTAADSGHPLGL